MAMVLNSVEYMKDGLLKYNKWTVTSESSDKHELMGGVAPWSQTLIVVLRLVVHKNSDRLRGKLGLVMFIGESLPVGNVY